MYKNKKNYVKALLGTDKVEIEDGEMVVHKSVYQIPGQCY
jgi:hypothetical protein